MSCVCVPWLSHLSFPVFTTNNLYWFLLFLSLLINERFYMMNVRRKIEVLLTVHIINRNVIAAIRFLQYYYFSQTIFLLWKCEIVTSLWESKQVLPSVCSVMNFDKGMKSANPDVCIIIRSRWDWVTKHMWRPHSDKPLTYLWSNNLVTFIQNLEPYAHF